jgi:hypothetical protein
MLLLALHYFFSTKNLDIQAYFLHFAQYSSRMKNLFTIFLYIIFLRLLIRILVLFREPPSQFHTEKCLQSR